MPWSHCGVEISDEATSCPGCGLTKEQWTLEFDVTRTFQFQRRVLFRLTLVDASGSPLADAPFELRLPDGTWTPGTLDAAGFAKVPSPTKGRGLVRFTGARGVVRRASPEREQPPLLQRGAEGDAVSDLQELLCERGYPVAVDGVFGPETEGAVRWFQADRGLEADGKVGPHTWGALEAVEPPPPLPSGLTREGDQGARVRRLQEALNAHGAALEVDGRFGPKTAEALRGFQSGQGLDDDATAGPTTWKALLADGAPPLGGCETGRKQVFELHGGAVAGGLALELYELRLPDDAELVVEGLSAPCRLRASGCYQEAQRRYVFALPDPTPGASCAATLEQGARAALLFEGVDLHAHLEALRAGTPEPLPVAWPEDWATDDDEDDAADDGDVDAEWPGDLAPPEEAEQVALPAPVYDYDPGSHAWGDN